MKILVDPEFHELIPPLAPEEYAQLEQNLLADGCRDPLAVWDNGGKKPILLDGHNRKEICEKHKLKYAVKVLSLPDRDHAKVWIKRNQIGRRNIPAYLRLEYKMDCDEWEARGRQAKENLRLSRGRGKKGSLISEKVIDRTKEIAAATGIGYDTASKAIKIREKADDETKEKLRRGETSINAAYTQIKRQEKEQKREQRRKENQKQVKKTVDPLKAGAKFATIVIDPPWDWGDEKDCDQLGRARPTYKTLSLKELLKLPVAKLADEDCHLYLWITNRSLPKGFQLIEKWGFRYITCLTWCKPSFGMGNYFRGQTEHVLFAIKGSQPLKRKNVGTWFAAPRGPDGHSSKPVEFVDLVESCSPAPFLEMFARSKRKGWVSWGAEI